MLGLFEELDVDLAAEDLVHAAHEAAAGLLVVVQVEEPAAGRDAARWMDHPVAERAAAAALVQLCCGLRGKGLHPASVGQWRGRVRLCVRRSAAPRRRARQLGAAGAVRGDAPVSAEEQAPLADREQDLVVAAVVADDLLELLEEAVGHARGHVQGEALDDRLGRRLLGRPQHLFG